MRITVACPENLIDDANHLAMVLAESVADSETYRNPSWQDSEGNLYAAASFVANEEWIGRAQTELTRPDWDTENVIDMVAANRAQAALVFEVSPNTVTATPTALTALGGPSGREALEAMGLTQVIQELV